MKKIVLASNNKHKIEEFRKILKDYEVLSLSDINFTDEIIEDGKTFEENATIKATTIYNYLDDENTLVVSDDSGLCCNALNGNPGIYSARFAGDHNDKNNRDKLINDLKDKDKSAYFVCGIVLIGKNIKEYFEGRVYGNIIDEERGKTDFGYDCIFYSTELNKTFGEATEEEKNNVSHRGRAIEKLVAYLENNA